MTNRGGAASFPIVGVGASAGGLEAFTQLLKHLPLDTGMGFVLVQHLDPEHESALAQILARATSLSVNEITDNQPILPDHVYVIPRDTSLSIEHGVLKLKPRLRVRTLHRPIDSFFESLAQDQCDRAIGVVLSGTASDGTLGLEAIKAEGGITFAQDDSAKHNSMPRSAVAAGCVDLVLSPADIAKELGRIAKHPYATRPSLEPTTSPEDDRVEATAHEDDDSPLLSGSSRQEERSSGKKLTKGGHPSRVEAKRGKAAEGAEDTNGGRDAENGYKKILLLLRNHSGVDFSLYKSTTIQRRINRRIVLTRHKTLTDYAGFLQGDPKELDALYSDVLISVTSFFRNPEMFDALQHRVMPELLAQRGDDLLRCWVLGCSTGQEAYSIAISFVEAAEEAPRLRKLQIFATDLNDALLAKARQGLYAKSLADDITPERLRRFFVEEEGGYRVSKPLREMVLFARQNLITDPPFSRLDLISCRNLLIYLEPTLQRKALPTFHYALKPGGFLLLGASESVGGFTDLFEPVDKKYKIYSKRPALTPAFHLPVPRAHGEQSPLGHRPVVPTGQQEQPEPSEGLLGELNAQREADRITVNQFAPPSVLVNDALQVLQFRGPTGAYLEPPSGKASFDVLKMAQEGLKLPLRAAINQARKENKTARKENVRVQRNGQTHKVNLEVIPLKNLRERCFLILFEEADATGRTNSRVRRAKEPETPPISKGEQPARIAALETELFETREYLQSIQEQHESDNEELQAANEEAQSANEELQSINEELETSKEELESANEELITVNEEMSNRNVELNRINNDLVNLQSSTKLAIVLLARDLTIRRFSPQAEKQFDLLATDLGRPISHIRHNLVCAPQAVLPESGSQLEPQQLDSPVDLESIAAETLASVREQEREVRDRAGRWHSLRVRPYVTLDNMVDGAVLVLVDIDAIKRSEQAIAAARDYAENTIGTVREPLLILDMELRIESANPSFYRTFRVTPKETIGRMFYDLGSRQWNIHRLRALLEAIIGTGTTVEDFLVEYDSETIGKRIMLLNARRVIDPHHNSKRILLAIEDITERKHAETALHDSEERFRTLADNMTQLAWIADPKGWIYWYNQRWYDYTGTTLEQMRGWGWEEIIHPDHVDRVVARLQHSWNTGDPWADTFPLRGKDREYRWFLSSARPIRDVDGTVLRWFGTNTDVTEQLSMEDQIKRQAKQLADESRRKDEFLAMLSHELRNPLAPIRSAVQVLRIHEHGNDNAPQRQAREIIERQVTNLTKLVSDLLEVTRFVSGRVRVNLQAVDVNEIIKHAMETVKPLIEQHHHDLVLNLSPNPIWANADPMRMEEVFINLLNNAAKYTPDRGRIEVWCEHLPAENAVLVRVRDNGPGIDNELLPGIFDLFTQADRSLARSAGGLGIGLSLAQQLVNLHGGTIEAHSPPEGSDVGSEFIVKLPRMAVPPELGQHGAQSAETPHHPAGTRVLVVDDNVDQVELLTHLLRESGYSVQSCYTGPEGLLVAQQWRPDVVLLDIGLPGLDGYEVARRLRRDPIRGDSGAQMRLIALTGYGRDTDIALARQAGFDAHVVKPFEFDALEKLIAPTNKRPLTPLLNAVARS
jgi:two-component system, chemotaxis family, CheB/CheR fusion protein